MQTNVNWQYQWKKNSHVLWKQHGFLNLDVIFRATLDFVCINHSTTITSWCSGHKELAAFDTQLEAEGEAVKVEHIILKQPRGQQQKTLLTKYCFFSIP